MNHGGERADGDRIGLPPGPEDDAAQNHPPRVMVGQGVISEEEPDAVTEVTNSSQHHNDGQQQPQQQPQQPQQQPLSRQESSSMNANFPTNQPSNETSKAAGVPEQPQNDRKPHAADTAPSYRSGSVPPQPPAAQPPSSFPYMEMAAGPTIPGIPPFSTYPPGPPQAGFSFGLASHNPPPSATAGAGGVIPPTSTNSPQQAFAAGAAWAAAQIAAAAADYAAGASQFPTAPPNHHHPAWRPPTSTTTTTPTFPGVTPQPPPPHLMGPPGYFHHPYVSTVAPHHHQHAYPLAWNFPPSSFTTAVDHPPHEQAVEGGGDEVAFAGAHEPQHPRSGGGGLDNHDSTTCYHAGYSLGAAVSADAVPRHRRKRQQRLPPPSVLLGGANFSATTTTTGNHMAASFGASSSTHPTREKVRRRLRQSDGDSSTSSGTSTLQQHGTCYHHPPLRSALHHHPPGRSRHYRKKKARSDDSLLGKTGVSALYEWCSKRQRTPIFQQVNPPVSTVVVASTSQVASSFAQPASEPVQDPGGGEVVSHTGTATTTSSTTGSSNNGVAFDFVVALNDEEDFPLGHGRGATKSAAKQMAARTALQKLLPGVVFDQATGILIQLTTTHSPFLGTSVIVTNQSTTSADDLAPNLAKRLAIGRDEDLDPVSNTTLPVPKAVVTTAARAGTTNTKRSLDAYPGTSTTSEEEDENTYYTSRGASVCSALLHAMVQIDSRIPNPPEYTFNLGSPQQQPQSLTEPTVGGNNPNLRRKTQTQTAIRVHRGPFTCNARLVLVKKTNESSEVSKEKTTGGDSRLTSSEPSVAPESQAVADHEILEAVGVGGTKREARHVASAKLLALLFPECQTMVEVKAAAEAAREKYAASKALKHSTAANSFSLRGTRNNNSNNNPATVKSEDRSMAAANESSNPSSAPALSTGQKSSGSPSIPLSERRRQFDAQVDRALRVLNEQDEDGRSLPAEITVDDVGRTLLRRAEEKEDSAWLQKLLGRSGTAASATKPYPEDETPRPASIASNFTAPTTVVLLLCRAIAPHEDPPLGCAVLSLGFSGEAGRLLYVVEIANEPHLPQERFLECLEAFARVMKCQLETNAPAATIAEHNEVAANSELCGILESSGSSGSGAVESKEDDHTLTGSKDESHVESSAKASTRVSFSTHTTALQSVKEESEVSDASVERRTGMAGGGDSAPVSAGTKPSKRTRVQ